MEIAIEERKEKLIEKLNELEKSYNDLSKNSYIIKIDFKTNSEFRRNMDFHYLFSSGAWEKLPVDKRNNRLDMIEDSVNRAEIQLNKLHEFLGEK